MKVFAEVADALTKAGGKNPKGQPNFRFAWSGTETYKISNGKAYEDFRIVAEDCWLLMKWEPAEFWGTKEEWEINNWEPSGLLTAGPYPSEGRYRVVRHLKHPVIKDGIMSFDHPMPTLKFVDEIFPLLQGFLELSTEQKADLLAARELNEKAELAKKFAASRELYRGSGTAKEIKKQTEKIERFLKDPERVKAAMSLKRRTT